MYPLLLVSVKNVLRKQMLEKRDAISESERLSMAEEIFRNLLTRPAFLNAKIVGAYLAKGSEVDTRKIIEYCIGNGKTVAVPSTNEEIEMVKFLGFDKLAKGRFGILEPTEKMAVQTPDVMIIPGVAFGLCMHRIGYGKGYYDAYLKKNKTYRIGICYDFQLLERLPSHEWDERMDEIITDKRIIVKKE